MCMLRCVCEVYIGVYAEVCVCEVYVVCALAMHVYIPTAVLTV